MEIFNHSEILSKLPGSVEVAGLFDIAPQAVSNWRRRGRIPKGYIPFLREKYPAAFCVDPEKCGEHQ